MRTRWCTCIGYYFIGTTGEIGREEKLFSFVFFDIAISGVNYFKPNRVVQDAWKNCLGSDSKLERSLWCV
jgi:hypothetical protein